MRPINETTTEGILASIRIDIVVYVASGVLVAAILVLFIKVIMNFQIVFFKDNKNYNRNFPQLFFVFLSLNIEPLALSFCD